MRPSVLYLYALFSIFPLLHSTAQADDVASDVLQRWKFDATHLSAGTFQPESDPLGLGLVATPARKDIQFGDQGTLVLDEGQFLIVRGADDQLPQSEFTVEAWVRVNQPTRWGSIIGFQQDNGAYEKGWSIGYNNDRFEFRVSDGIKIVNATASTTMKLGSWHHVVGICDAKNDRLLLYIDGIQQGEVTFDSDGPAYPDPTLKTELVIGAYKDKDELFPMQGRLSEVRIHRGVLSSDQITANAALTDKLLQKPLKFSVRPGIRFLSPSSAEVRWETTIAGPAALAYGPTRKLGSILSSGSTGTSHRVLLENLVPGQDYWYRFGLNRSGKRSFSPFYQLEGGMNYTPPRIIAKDIPDVVSNVVDQLSQLGGYAVVDANVAKQWTTAIASSTTMTVVAVSDDEATVNALRKAWYSKKQYGVRLTAQLWTDVPSQTANLVITDAQNAAQAMRLMSPSGRMVIIGTPPELDGVQWKNLGVGVAISGVSDDSGLAAWGHQYGSAANTSYSGEMLGGVDDTADLKIKWIGRPGADFGIDRNPRMPAPLAVGGRLFHQGMNRMIALDAFNGAVLWSLEIPDLRRVNIPRDSANWCADRHHVFAAVKDRLWVIDAASGEMQRTLLLPQQYESESEWGYVAVTEKRVIGTAVKAGSSYSGFWDKSSWYDGKGDAATAKVCGTAIMGYDKEYGSIDWKHEADAIVQSTITIAGNHLYFVQVDDPTLRDLPTGKLTNDRIWKTASVVCLDLETGQQLWKSKVPAQDHEAIISFGVADSSQFVLQTSGKNQFHFLSLGAEKGDTLWNQSVDWPEDHHGAHVQHSVLMNGRIYVQPHIIDATNGTVLKSGTLGKRRGCATPIGAGNSIIYRGGTGPLTLWSLENDQPSEFTRLRPSCWLSTIPAQGMLFSPEGGGGCSCGGWMETSIGFAPVLPTGEAK